MLLQPIFEYPDDLSGTIPFLAAILGLSSWLFSPAPEQPSVGWAFCNLKFWSSKKTAAARGLNVLTAITKEIVLTFIIHGVECETHIFQNDGSGNTLPINVIINPNHNCLCNLWVLENFLLYI